jgi:hypothetical protein
MPGFDGTGPMGQGPMTGGGRGFCAMPYRVYGAYGYGMRARYNPSFGGYQFSERPIGGPIFGAGRGRVFGGGRGFRRWWW